MTQRPEAAVLRGYAAFDGRQIHYRLSQPEQAGRPPLFLLHPTPKSGWIYEEIMPLLAAGGRMVVAPDTPGYGASDALPGTPSIEGFAAANLALADQLGFGQFDVLGYHTGSVTAVAMAGTAPQRVRRAVLFSIPAYDREERSTRLAGLSDWPQPDSGGRHLAAMWDLVGKLADPRAGTAWRHRSVAENLRAIDPPAGYGAVYRFDLQAALAGLRQPVLLVNPEDDLWDVTRAHRHLIPAGDYRELRGTAHGLFDFAAEELSELIAGFLD